jgi:ATP-dependent DNA helicase DinG
MLDRRIQHVNYGNIFVESLPPYRITTDIADVQRFMGRIDSGPIANSYRAEAREIPA